MRVTEKALRLVKARSIQNKHVLIQIKDAFAQLDKLQT